jgi:hypothetical protein
MPHRFSLLSLALVPFVLLSLSSSYVHARMEETREKYVLSQKEAWQELHTLDNQFLSMQRVRSLVQNGEGKISFPSLAKSYLEEEENSLFTNTALLQEHLQAVREGIALLQARLAPIGRKAIYIDLSEQKATVIERGSIVAQYQVSSGAADTPTPKGEFEIHKKQKLRVSGLETPYRMPYYMAFTPNASHGLHALPYLGESPESSGYWQEAQSHIGIPVSHGCVRFLPEDAATIFDWAEVGTKVYIQA